MSGRGTEIAVVRRATAKDVAELAGVSRSAVSQTLNGRGDGNIAPAKQEAIRAAAAVLRYTPSAVGRSLRDQRTHTIGVVTDSIVTSAFGGRLLSGAIDEAADAGYVVLVLDAREHDTTGGSPDGDQRVAAAFDVLRGRQAEGLMFAAMELRPFTATPAMTELPSVIAQAYERDGRVAAVSCDEVGGGRTAAQALIDRGHREIAMLAGSGDVVAAQRRIEGFRQATTAAGLQVPAPVPTGWSIDDGHAAASALLDRPDRPTGIVCANDRVAIGVVLAAAQRGVRVPQDLSVVGYDDDETVAAAMVPALTTVAIPHRAMGETAMRRLLAGLGSGLDQLDPRLVELPCPLVERASVAPPSR